MVLVSLKSYSSLIGRRIRLFVTSKPKKAAGPEGIPSVVLKLFAFELAPAVADLYNSTLREGFILPLLKSAIVHLLPKVTHPKCIDEDVRPISLTCQLAKVLEGFTLARVYQSIYCRQPLKKPFRGNW